MVSSHTRASLFIILVNNSSNVVTRFHTKEAGEKIYRGESDYLSVALIACIAGSCSFLLFSRFVIVTNRCMIDKHMEKVHKQNRTTLDEDCLRWTPLVHTNLALIDDGEKAVNGLDGLGRRNRPSVTEQDVDIVNDQEENDVSKLC